MHTAGVVGSIERDGESRLGLEIYYNGRQSREDNSCRATSRSYLIVGLLAERRLDTLVGRARFFVNAENIGNVRQTRFDPLVLPTRGVGGRGRPACGRSSPGRR
jgi:iron complex outermembrane receptor protein